jgi:hypothetical protein
MGRNKGKARSVPQRKLMGYAYACATGKATDCPPSVMDVARSFTSKKPRKGLKALKRMASTSHEGLPTGRLSESRILKYKDFKMRESVSDKGGDLYYLDYLYSLNDNEINGYVNEFATTGDLDDKAEYIWCINRRIDQLKRSGRKFDETELALMRMSMEEVLQDSIKKKIHDKR